MDCRATLDQLAFVLRSVAEDAYEIPELPPGVAERLQAIIKSVEADAAELESLSVGLELNSQSK